MNGVIDCKTTMENKSFHLLSDAQLICIVYCHYKSLNELQYGKPHPLPVTSNIKNKTPLEMRTNCDSSHTFPKIKLCSCNCLKSNS